MEGRCGSGGVCGEGGSCCWRGAWTWSDGGGGGTTVVTDPDGDAAPLTASWAASTFACVKSICLARLLRSCEIWALNAFCASNCLSWSAFWSSNLARRDSSIDVMWWFPSMAVSSCRVCADCLVGARSNPAEEFCVRSAEADSHLAQWMLPIEAHQVEDDWGEIFSGGTAAMWL